MAAEPLKKSLIGCRVAQRRTGTSSIVSSRANEIHLVLRRVVVCREEADR